MNKIRAFFAVCFLPLAFILVPATNVAVATATIAAPVAETAIVAVPLVAIAATQTGCAKLAPATPSIVQLQECVENDAIKGLNVAAIAQDCGAALVQAILALLDTTDPNVINSAAYQQALASTDPNVTSSPIYKRAIAHKAAGK